LILTERDRHHVVKVTLHGLPRRELFRERWRKTVADVERKGSKSETKTERSLEETRGEKKEVEGSFWLHSPI